MAGIKYKLNQTEKDLFSKYLQEADEKSLIVFPDADIVVYLAPIGINNGV